MLLENIIYDCTKIGITYFLW